MHTMPAPTSPWRRLLSPGVIMMVLGAILVLAGIVQTTTSHFNEPSCPQGTTLIAKFNYSHHDYDFEKPAGNEHVVTLSHESADGAWWSSTQLVSAIIVKGGSSSVLYSIAPPQVTGSFSNEGLPDAGHSHHPPDISNVQFCGPNGPAGTTTTAQATTTSSSTTSTSTSTSTTTSTSQPTSTTCGQCETTTTHVPTTTCECTTTTYHPPTTCKCSTTTTHPQETTTTHEQETTTTVSGSTTSSSEVSGSTVVGSTSTTAHGSTSTTHRGSVTTVAGQGSTTSFGPTVSSTSVFTGDGPSLPFTGSSSTPLVALGVVLLATGLTLTLSQARRRERTQG